MRARWLKPEFFTDKKVAANGPIAALVYQALWCMADDGGTSPCDPDTVKAQMFYRWSAVGVPEITEALHALSVAGRIIRYVVGDDTYCTIPTWDDHQQVHKPSKFRNPSISQGVALAVPEQCGTGAAPLPASPPPRHLDSQTPRELDGAGAPARSVRVVRPPRSAPQVWATEGATWWEGNVGDMTPSGFQKALARMVTIHGWPSVFADLRKWVASKKAAGKAIKLAWYTEVASARITAPPPPPITIDGVLTEYGERITRPDKVPA